MLPKHHMLYRPALWLAVVLSGAAPFAAASDADLLRVLEQKGYLSAAEVRELTASRELEAKAAAEKAENEKASLFVTAPVNKNALELNLSGRFQFQYDGMGARIDNGGNSTTLPSKNAVSFRRLFLGTSLKLRNDWYATAQFNFAGSGSTTGGLVDQVRVGWKPDRDLNVWVGYDKVPFGYDATTSSARLLTIENAPSTNFFTRTLAFNNYHSGGSVIGKIDGGFDYQLMLANGAQGFSGSGSGYSVWARLQHTTEFADSDTALMVGADVGYQSRNGSGAAWLSNASIIGYGAYARLTMGDLLLLGEFLGTSIEGVGGYGHSNPYTLMGMAAYSLGDIQPVFQYAYIDSGNFAGGINPADLMRSAPTDAASMGSIAGPHRMHTFYLGANYYIMGNDLRVSAGGIYATAPSNSGSGGNNTSYEAFGARAQLQVLF